MTTAAVLPSSALHFDAPRHEYTLPDGRIVPSVTHILHACGIATDFEALAAFGNRIAETIEFRLQLGTAVHSDAHAYDDNDLDWSAVDERVAPYIEAWATFRDNSGLTPVARERRVFDPTLFYCGTLDGVFQNAKGRLVLVDIKIGDPEDAGAAYQTAAYESAYLLEHPEQPIEERWAVRLQPDRVIPYSVTNYSGKPQSWRHFQIFQSAVAVYGAQAARRSR